MKNILNRQDNCRSWINIHDFFSASLSIGFIVVAILMMAPDKMPAASSLQMLNSPCMMATADVTDCRLSVK